MNGAQQNTMDWMTYILLLLFFFMMGLIGYLFFSLYFTLPFYREIFQIMETAYTKVGVTFLPLAALSAYLVAVLFFLLLDRAGLFEFRRSPRYHLLWIENASPMLGFLGTLIGLAEAMSGLDTSKGIQTTVVWLTAKTGEAIYSSIYGAIQALIAYGVRFLFHLDGDGGTE